MSKTSSAVKQRWNEKNYDRLAVTVPKGKKADIEAHASAVGLSVNGLVNELLRKELSLSNEEWRSKQAGE